MKIVVAAVIILTITSALIVGNCIFIKCTVSDLIKTLEKNDSSVYVLAEFGTKWEGKKGLFSLSISNTRIEEIDKLKAQAESFNLQSDSKGYQLTIDQIKCSLEEIIRSESFVWEEIL